MQRLVAVFLEAGEDETLIRSYADRLQMEEEPPEDTSSSVIVTSSSATPTAAVVAAVGVRHAIVQLLLRNVSALGM